ncbi:hypothetical protein [Halomonas organivorans]|uniref:Uncharacterized protein n=1 Tax=Halomonas organivorans TaxID=257772 RepID=A0A7W5BY86_9GAMM|nr:hypothetical protein [Halomonas organivorans]MBB3141217.1 hypothetical protein [Halomonas organivorans]
MSLSGSLDTLRQAINNTLGVIDGKLRNKADKAEVYTRGDVDTALATKADKSATLTPEQVDARLQALIDSAPASLDTLNELAAALGDDPDFAATVTTALAAKATTAQLADLESRVGDGFTQLAQAFDDGAALITSTTGA